MENRSCKVCHKEFPLTEEFFNRNDARGKVYFKHECRICLKARCKKRNELNKDKTSKFNKEYHAKNRDSILKKKRDRYASIKNSPEYKEHQKCKTFRLYWNNPEKHRKESRERSQLPESREKINERIRKKYHSDINFKIAHRLRTRLRQALEAKTCRKLNSAINLLGCNAEKLKQWIELNFSSEMSWKNFGCCDNCWSLDHHFPCSSFDLSDLEQQKKCFNWKNIFPLWHRDNMSKSDNIIPLSENQTQKIAQFEAYLHNEQS